MRLTVDELKAQYTRATTNWRWILDAEEDHGVPPFLLYALGSRETNLKNIIGDGGHGYGIWQRDNRSFVIPEDYLQTPYQQALDAGTLLMGHFVYFRGAYPKVATWRAAICAYNAGRGGVRRALDAGQTPDSATTNDDYGDDVLQRWSYLARWGWDLL